MQQWIDQDITEAQQKQQVITAELNRPNQQLTPIRRDQLNADFDSLQRSIETRQRIQPYAEYLPNDPFQTVAVFVLILLAATALKNLFIVGNLVSTSWAVQRTTVDLQNEYARRVLGLDLSSYDSFGTSQLVTHFTESIEHVSRGLQVLLGVSVREPMKMISCVIGAFADQLAPDVVYLDRSAADGTADQHLASKSTSVAQSPCLGFGLLEPSNLPVRDLLAHGAGLRNGKEHGG